jgi:hypothetical protein
LFAAQGTVYYKSAFLKVAPFVPECQVLISSVPDLFLLLKNYSWVALFASVQVAPFSPE